MNITLEGKRALVGGSTQGIGKAIALAMAEAGAQITLLARNEEKLRNTLQELDSSYGQIHHYLVADFVHPDQLEEQIISYLQKNPAIHILVNNTGGPPPGSVLEAKVHEFTEAFSRHLLCNQLLCQHIVPSMKKAGYGRILNIISTSVKEPMPGLGVSNTIRASVAGWSKTLSREVAPWGITVNNILPGYTKTARLSSLIESKAASHGKSKEEIEQEMLLEIPAKRFAEPGELAALAVFLSSPLAGYINGVNIQIDGGKTSSF